MDNLLNISFKRNNGFPKSEYAFCDGSLSVVMDCNGGIDELEFIKIWYENGIPFPDQKPMPIITRRSAAIRNHPGIFYGAPIRFLSTQKNGPIYTTIRMR